MPLVLNQATNMRTGKPTGRDHDGHTPLQRLANDASRLERVLANLDSNGDDLDDDEEVTVNASLTKTWDTSGTCHIINLEDVIDVRQSQDAVHVRLREGISLDLDFAEAMRIGLDVDERPRTPKSSDGTYSGPLDGGPVNPQNPLQTHALEMPVMSFHNPSKTRTQLVANVVEPCCNDENQTNVPPTLEFAYEEVPAGPSFASYGGRDDAGDVLPMPVMTY